MDFRRRLAEAIKRKECSRADLAAALGVSVQAIGLVLSGDTRALTAENAAKAARFLGVDYYWLATGEGDIEPNTSWPIKRISVDRFLSLAPEDRAYVEGKIASAIEDCEGQKTTATKVDADQAGRATPAKSLTVDPPASEYAASGSSSVKPRRLSEVKLPEPHAGPSIITPKGQQRERSTNRKRGQK